MFKITSIEGERLQKSQMKKKIPATVLIFPPHYSSKTSHHPVTKSYYW